MRKIFSLALILLMQCIFVFGQNPKEVDKLRTLIKLYAAGQGIGFSVEPRLTNKLTLDLSTGAGLGNYVNDDGVINYDWDFQHPVFYFSAAPKFYYNRQKRSDKGKTTALNSGDYIGMRLKYSAPFDTHNEDLHDALLINLHWGLQRAIGKRWTFNAQAGGGYAQDLTSGFGTIYPAVDFQFSYILSKIIE